MRKLMQYTCLFLAFSILILSNFALSACSKWDSFSWSAFNTVCSVYVEGKSLSNDVKSEITALTKNQEKIFSSSDGGEVYKISNADAKEKIYISNDLLDVLNKSKFCYNLTSGKFDPTISKLAKFWHFYPDFPVSNFTPPTSTEINDALQYVGFDKITISNDKNGDYVEKQSKETEIDFGGIAKGYIADKIAKILTDNGYSAGYVSIGSSSIDILSCDKLSIRHPDSSDKTLITINTENLQNVSVSTSGNYEKYYDYNGTRYCHIIDPESGYPTSSGIQSATIICNDGSLADGLTTAICLCSHDTENPTDPNKSELVSLLNTITNEPSLSSSLYFVALEINGKKQLLTNVDSSLFTLDDDSFAVIKL